MRLTPPHGAALPHSFNNLSSTNDPLQPPQPTLPPQKRGAGGGAGPGRPLEAVPPGRHKGRAAAGGAHSLPAPGC